VLVITGAAMADAARAAAPQVPRENVIGEPCGRDTAAACALACALVKACSPQAAFCILTADHVIEDLEVFRQTLRQALALAAETDRLLTIGIPPAFPSTGFGYIETAGRAAERAGVEFLAVRRFVEKPDRATAERFLAAGSYYWNSGMFIWSVRAFAAALARHAPAWSALAERVGEAVGRPDFDAVLRAEYERIEKLSVDYAVMEKADNIWMARGAFRWDDVGSWPALANHLTPDAAGNAVLGQCEALDATGNVVVSRDRLTALIGVQDLVVVHAEGATLICPKHRAQDVRDLVRRLAARPDGERWL